jgi:hypothetical protein
VSWKKHRVDQKTKKKKSTIEFKLKLFDDTKNL